jgi:hypothetical protein
MISKIDQKIFEIKKDNSSTRNSNNTMKLLKSKLTEHNISKENSKFILPPIKNSFKQKELQKPTSILTKFIHKQATSLIKEANDESLKPNLKYLHLYPYSCILPGQKKPKLTKCKTIDDNLDLISLNNKDKDKNGFHMKQNIPSKFKKVLLTESNNNNNNKINKKKLLKFNLNNNDDNINNISNIYNRKNINNKEESFINDKELRDIISPKSFPSSIVVSPLTTNDEFNLSEVNSEFKTENNNKKKINSSKFKRICRYLPLNKSLPNSGLRRKVKSLVAYHHIYYPDTEQQSQIFKEQMNLIKEDINQYLLCKNRDNFFEIFKSMSLDTKIKYNQTLEQTIGILLNIPHMVLGDFYKYLNGVKEIKIPKKENFGKEYIYDEIKKVTHNHKLLSEVDEFIHKSFEFYLFLKSKIDSDDLALNEKDYFNALSQYEKVRDNICYVTNSYNNAEKNYKADLSIINKITRMNRIIANKSKSNSKEREKDDSININNKSYKKIEPKAVENMQRNLFFKGNKERERILRIDSAVAFDKNRKIYDYLGNERKIKRNEFKPLFNMKLVKNLMNYYDEDTRVQIINNKINNEIDNDNSINKPKVLKMDF